MNEPETNLKSRITQSIVVLCTVMAIIATVFCTSAFSGTSSGEEAAALGDASHVKVTADSEMSEAKAGVMKFALIAAAIAFGLGAIGAGIAISHVGAAAMGAIAEKPEIASQALIFIALAEGLVVFGFITAILILNKA
jgi:V/A-type H+-transporting ATPase subunit K